MKKMALALGLWGSLSVFVSADDLSRENKRTVCAACHGPQGVSVLSQWPSLAGQHADYLVKQIQDMKDRNGREVPSMTSVVTQLSELDIADIAAFYASKPIPENSTPKKYMARGEQLYRGGDFSRHITACIACHGPKGTGNAEAGFPVLSGQQANYTIQQLHAFKDKTRQNDLFAIMRDISARMSDNDIDAVSYYVAGLH